MKTLRNKATEVYITSTCTLLIFKWLKTYFWPNIAPPNKDKNIFLYIFSDSLHFIHTHLPTHTHWRYPMKTNLSYSCWSWRMWELIKFDREHKYIHYSLNFLKWCGGFIVCWWLGHMETVTKAKEKGRATEKLLV